MGEAGMRVGGVAERGSGMDETNDWLALPEGDTLSSNYRRGIITHSSCRHNRQQANDNDNASGWGRRRSARDRQELSRIGYTRSG
jgi:hypothetical protein